MAKTIDTLIKDIYAVFEIQNEPDEEVIKEFGDTVASILQDRVLENRTGADRLRLSQIGTPNRKVWYGLKNYDRKPLTGQDKLKFMYGDIVEAMLVALIKLAGHTVTEEQKEVTVEGVKGHIDFYIDDVLVDAKSASSYGYRKFADGSILNGNDPFGYVAQMSAYAEAEGQDEGAFLVFNKENAQLALVEVDEMDMINASDRVKELKDVAESTGEPARCYDDVPDGVSGNRTLPIGCVWCDFKSVCWRDANHGKGLRAFKYAKGPKYLTNVASEPRVEEITK